MNLRSVRTLIVSSLFAATLLQGQVFAQDGAQGASGLTVETPVLHTETDFDADITYTWTLDDWDYTAVFVDGVFSACINKTPNWGIGQSGSTSTETIPLSIPGIANVPGTYSIQTLTEPTAGDSSCSLSQAYYAGGGPIPGCFLGGCPADDLVVLTTGTFTVNKEWQPGRQNALVDFAYACSDGTAGSGQASTAVPFEFELAWDVSGPTPTCTITEAPIVGYTDITGAACTDVPMVSQGDASCTLVNDVIPVPFTVRKAFSDGNNQAEVTVSVTCSNPATVINTVKATASAGSPAEFTIDNIRANGSTTCTATESNIPPGYTADEGVCTGSLVLVDGGSCDLTNDQDPVTLYIDKVYPNPHPGGAALDPEVDITMTCDSALVNGAAGSATATTVDGRAEFVVSEFLFYGSGCYATEVVPAGYVQDASDDSCGSAAAPGILVTPGGIQYDPPGDPAAGPGDPAACTITNIPTTATFTVQKDFSDNNPMAVDVTATCSDDGVGPGLTLNGAAAGTAQGSSSEGTPFAVVINYLDGSATCDAVEDNDLPGYTTIAGDGPAADCGTGQSVATDSTDVACEIFNDQDPIEIQASKVYSNGGGAAVDFAVSCTGVGSVSPATDEASPGSPATFIVNDVNYDGSSTCSVSEPVPPGGYYETGNTCTVDGIDLTPNSDDPRTCEITNTPTRATFKVTKIFADGNNVDEIEVSIDCNTGLILDQDKDLGHNDHVEFVVTSFTEGTLNCTITEDGQAGYAGEYNNLSTSQGVNDLNCEYTEVGGGDAFECEITNTPLPVEISVYKDWVFSGTTAPDINTYIEIVVICDSEIVDFSCPIFGPASNSPYDVPASDAEDFRMCYGNSGLNDVGMSVWVVPDFPSTQCTVFERIYDQAIEQDNGCGTFDVKVLQGKECVITNTVFFEGIPTLSQYGMALLALLMLGVGFVSFRRFA